mmetsp:Transcript_63080/g.186366  ORF Transcript_63080/g.186366 Transcript_63080/m.186366 type:complete len:202 (+) Transcript_63080:313-918(+)
MSRRPPPPSLRTRRREPRSSSRPGRPPRPRFEPAATPTTNSRRSKPRRSTWSTWRAPRRFRPDSLRGQRRGRSFRSRLQRWETCPSRGPSFTLPTDPRTAGRPSLLRTRCVSGCFFFLVGPYLVFLLFAVGPTARTITLRLLPVDQLDVGSWLANIYFLPYLAVSFWNILLVCLFATNTESPPETYIDTHPVVNSMNFTTN